MMVIEVLGMGCPKCKKTEEVVRRVVEEDGIDALVTHITDLSQISARGAMLTPAVCIDGKIVSEGKVPSPDDVRRWLKG